MEVASSLAGKVMDILFGVAKKEIGYMWKCSENVKTFKEEVENLTALKETLQQRIDRAKRAGEDPGQDLENWIKNTNVKISEATKLITEEDESKKTCCNLRFCVNLGTFYHYGKMTAKETTSLLQLKNEGEGYTNRVFDPLPTPGFTDLYQTKDLENIDTQKSTLKRIIQAVKDLQIVGIIGLGGVGKSTLASEAAAAMNNQFDHIESITVSQNIDAKTIKEKAQVAARKIKNGEKVLIILDDVWEELKLDEVGIPCGSRYMNCKILLTSRLESVCEAMDAKVINLQPLKEKEAWILFESVVGEREWDDKLKKIAVDIVKECGGLPLFVLAVGKALKNKEINSWEAALDRLRDPTDEDVPFKRKEIMQLKLSYDYLESEVAKSCFLLCSMFPEDGIIDLQRLTYYGLALGIFNNPDSTIQEAKHRVQVAVDSLKSSFLLLPGSHNTFKMHDLVRDMAMLVTSKGNDKYWVRAGTRLSEWQPKKHLESYNKISLIENRISNLHDHELVFLHLDTFLIQDNYLVTIPDEFFRGMEKLKVLDMSNNDIFSLPQSLKQLTILRTLDLRGNKSISEISLLGELTCLEILLLRRARITNIPEEIGQLTNLKLLDVYSCEHLSYVTPGVILKLIRLEELYVGLKEGNCNFLLELSKSLKILHLKVPGLNYIPEDVSYETLTEFLIEDTYFMDPADDYNLILRISGKSVPLTMSAMKLIQASEKLTLWYIKDLESVLADLYTKGCNKLKCIDLRQCENVRSLVNMYDLDVTQTSNELGQRGIFSQVEKIELYGMNKLELLWDSPQQSISFCNLAKIKITRCNSLLELFPISVAQILVKLRYIEISYCDSLVDVISTSDEQTSGSKTELVTQDTDVVFPLTWISLRQLPKLESFYSGHSIIKYPSLENMIVEECPSMKRWSYGDNYIPKIKFEHVGKPCSNINDYIAAQLEMNENLMIREKKHSDDTNGYHARTHNVSLRDTAQGKRKAGMAGKGALRFRDAAKKIAGT